MSLPRPPPPPPRPAVPLAPTLTSDNLCSDCHMPAAVTDDGAFKVCPKCYGVLWTSYRTDLERQRAEESARRRAAQEEAAYKRRLARVERQRAAAAEFAERARLSLPLRKE